MYLNFDLLVPISNEDIENWGKNPKEFQCQDCGRQCKDQQSFENHKQFHKYYLGNSSVQKLCDKCDRNIPKRLFQRHLESVHQIAKSSVNILKEGIFLTLSEKGFTRTRQVWQNFCKISYQDHRYGNIGCGVSSAAIQKYKSPFILRTQLRDPQFFQNYDHFQ